VRAHETGPAGASVRHGLAVGLSLERRGWADLDGELDWKQLPFDEAVEALRAEPPDVLLVDGGASQESLAVLCETLGDPGDPVRPAVLVVTPDHEGRVGEALRAQADDVVNGALGREELQARLRAAVRVRGFVRELSRKNAELETLYARLETLAGRMAEELRLASNVQRSLMPPPPNHPRLDVAREFIPFREIGGDFYDLVLLSPSRMAFAIGDVMGKGVSAALLAASLKACLRARLLSGPDGIDEIVAGVNRLFWEVSPPGLFATLFFAFFDLEAGRLEYVNAGHHYPFVVRADGEVQDLVEGGTVLGLVEQSTYQKGAIRVGRGDLLVFYSDGVTDREDDKGESFGTERLKEVALRTRGDDARIALYTLLGEVQGWAAGHPPDDDMTLVVTRVR